MRILVSTALFSLLCLPVFAETGAKGSVTGRVVDNHGHAVADAHVRAIANNGATSAEAAADAKGAFRLDLDPGQYHLEVDAEGFIQTSLTDPVSIEAGHETKLKRKIELREAD